MRAHRNARHVRLTHTPIMRQTKADSDDILTDVKRGIAYHGNDSEQVIADFNVAIERDPSCALAHYNRGVVRLGRGDTDNAIVDFDSAIDLDPLYTEAYGNRGIAWHRKGDLDRAICDYNEGLRIKLGAIADRNRRTGRREQSDLVRTIADLTDAIRLDPTNANSYANRGHAYTLKGEYDRAIADLSRALQMRPAATDYHNRGSAWLNSGDVDCALADYTEAIRLNPADAMIFIDRARAWHEKGRFAQAVGDYTTALRLDPNSSIAYGGRGAAWGDQGDFENAIDDFTQALELDPEQPDLHIGRGHAWSAKGKLAHAVNDFEQALRLAPHSLIARRGAGVARFANGDFAEAAALFDVHDFDDKAFAMLFRFLARARAGEDAAAELAANATQLQTQDWRYPLIELFLGHRALKDATSAATKHRIRVGAYCYFGQWHLLNGNREEAMADFQYVLATCPKGSAEYTVALGELRRLKPWWQRWLG